MAAGNNWQWEHLWTWERSYMCLEYYGLLQKLTHKSAQKNQNDHTWSARSNKAFPML